MNGQSSYDEVIETFTDKYKAIEWTRENYSHDKQVVVTEKRYDTQENLDKNLHCDYRHVWGSFR